MSKTNFEQNSACEHPCVSKCTTNQLQLLKVAKLDERKKFFYRFGNDNPGLVLGDESCKGVEGFQTKYIGWLWRVESLGVEGLKAGCIPKDILQQLQTTMKKLLNPLCEENVNRRTKCESNENKESSNDTNGSSDEDDFSDKPVPIETSEEQSPDAEAERNQSQRDSSELSSKDAQTQYDLNDFNPSGSLNDENDLGHGVETSKEGNPDNDSSHSLEETDISSPAANIQRDNAKNENLAIRKSQTKANVKARQKSQKKSPNNRKSTAENDTRKSSKSVSKTHVTPSPL